MSAAQASAFGDLLRRFRLTAGMTQEELAERAFLSARAVSDLERGVNRSPRRDTILLLVEALELEPEDRAKLEALVVRRKREAISAEKRIEAPGKQAAATYPSNLPLPMTAFIGRSPEVAAVHALLQHPDVRLLTLSGPGGSGKTRLALRVAAELAPDYGDDVHFVDLSPISNPALVLPTVAQVLGLPEAAARSPLQSLLENLRGRHLLLILDNFEQVVDAAPALADLLAACPKLHLLVTSRIILHLTGEQTFLVPPLAQPALETSSPGPVRSAAELAAYDAPTLFLERARAAKPDFAPGEEDLRAVIEVCRRLDGLPLAIELAAARIRLLPPRAMLTRLDQRLKLLRGGALDLPRRHQTLGSTLDWSYDLLDRSEQALFARLAVFVGSFTLEAAEAICQLDGEPEADVLDGIASLLDKSLLQTAEGPDGEPRFHMLETIREYALERLAALDGEAEHTRQRHLAWYTVLTEKAEPELTGPNQTAWLQRLEREHDNIRAALHWAIECGDAQSGLRLAGALWRFWYARGHLIEGDRWLVRLLSMEATSCTDSAAARVKALNGAGVLSYLQGDAVRATALYEEAVALGQTIGDVRGMTTSLTNLGMVAHYAGEHERATAQYEEALALSRELGDRRLIAVCLNNLGTLATDQGHHRRGAELIEESVSLFRTLGDRKNAAGLLTNLGNLAVATGEYERAEELCGESVVLLRGLNDRPGLAEALQSLAVVMECQGDLRRAADLHEEALMLGQELGEKWMIASAQNALGRIAFLWGDLTRAATLCEEGLVLQRELGYKQGIASSLFNLAQIAAARESSARAGELYSRSLALFHEVDDRHGMAASLEGLAGVALASQEAERAALLLGFVDSLRCEQGPVLSPSEQTVAARVKAAVSRALGEEFASAFTRGKAMSVEWALQEARGVAGCSPSRI